jgi:hypothetical protein
MTFHYVTALTVQESPSRKPTPSDHDSWFVRPQRGRKLSLKYCISRYTVPQLLMLEVHVRSPFLRNKT